MITPFEELIQHIGATLGLPLHLDSHGACCLQVNERLLVQIESDKKDERIIIAAFVGELSPGRFRQEVLKEALKANAELVTRGNAGGILGFCAHENQVSCHTFLSTHETSPEQLLASLTYLIEYALSWMEALQSGRSAPVETPTRSTLPTPFGIRP